MSPSILAEYIWAAGLSLIGLGILTIGTLAMFGFFDEGKG